MMLAMLSEYWLTGEKASPSRRRNSRDIATPTTTTTAGMRMHSTVSRAVTSALVREKDRKRDTAAEGRHALLDDAKEALLEPDDLLGERVHEQRTLGARRRRQFKARRLLHRAR